MHIYITEGNFDPALIPEARERFDRIYRHRPNQKIVIHKAQYPWSRLEEWETTITDATASDNTLGIVIWGISEQLRLINLRAIPMRGNRERIEAILAATDVPRDAIQLNIGGGRIPAELTVEKVSPSFKDTFAYWVEAQPRAQYGETVNLKLIIRNQTSEPALIYGGYNSLAFVISNESEENVWHWQPGHIIKDILLSQQVSPHKPLEFTGDWEQIDMKGYPAPPGIYHIRGALGHGLSRETGNGPGHDRDTASVTALTPTSNRPTLPNLKLHFSLQRPNALRSMTSVGGVAMPPVSITSMSDDSL